MSATGHAGPFWYADGTLDAEEKDLIFLRTGVNASIRARDQWGTTRRGLTLSGPCDKIDQAKRMAEQFIEASVQRRLRRERENPTAGSTVERAARTERHRQTYWTQRWVQAEQSAKLRLIAPSKGSPKDGDARGVAGWEVIARTRIIIWRISGTIDACES